MNPVSFIEAKRDGLENPPGEIAEFVQVALSGGMKDYQISSWLMAVFFRGMTASENRSFTEALAGSGKTVSFPEGLYAVDKHSTGGVGDKTTLVVVPLAAACGVPVAKLSGRGLGFTGGTVDKLDSIPGFRSSLDMASFIGQVEKIGCAVSGHSQELAPAEAIFYKLRDVTGTVPCIPLITSSIVSKKVAGGSSAFVFDVKCGSGAFMKDPESAKELARQLVDLSEALGRKAIALITDMSKPLGKWIGNAAEVMEAIDVLRGEGPEDTMELSLLLTGAMIHLGGKASSIEEGAKIAESVLLSGKGLEKFLEMTIAQGGNPEDFLDLTKRRRHLAPSVLEIEAVEEGWVTACDALLVGEVVRSLGGGRLTKEQEIDPSVSCEILAVRGQKVSKGQSLARLYCRKDDPETENAAEMIRRAYLTGDKPGKEKLVLGFEGSEKS
ncbi:MAG TPA: thymidine phosphorylase [Synergistetes bacterium]|nr:thymidine phosphorylase [Synergistota bacterium]